MRTKTRRSIGSCSVAAIGDSIEPETAEWQKEQNRPQCASFDEIFEILMTLFYGRFMGSMCLHFKQKVTQNGGPCSLDPQAEKTGPTVA